MDLKLLFLVIEGLRTNRTVFEGTLRKKLSIKISVLSESPLPRWTKEEYCRYSLSRPSHRLREIRFHTIRDVRRLVQSLLHNRELF